MSSAPSKLLANWSATAQASGHLPGQIIGPKESISYPELHARAQSVAAKLLEWNNGSLEGRRIGLLVEPGVDFIAAFFGVLQAGGTCLVLSPLHPDAESAYFCDDARAGLILVSSAWAERARRFAPNLEFQVIEELSRLSGTPQSASFPKISDSSPALQLYTSGTTGKPKGAVLTHGNLGVQQLLLREAWGLSTKDTLLHLLPLHHMHGLCISLLSTLSAGASVRFIPQFDAREIWERMSEATVLMAVPTIYAKLFQAYDDIHEETRARWQSHASGLRLATSGSAALPVTLAGRWRELTGKIPLERFGMTEVGVALSNPLSADAREPGSVGLALPTVRARIVNEAGEDADTGELWIAGPSVFSEYFGRESATAEAFSLHEGVRYFRTGDTVERDARGYFRILGRTSVDILKSGGYKLSALEIEEVFREHPGVSEVAVIGLPDPVWGDRVVACVVPRSPAPGMAMAAPTPTLTSTVTPTLTEDELRAFAKTRLASYKVPKEVRFLNELPRNALGKVIKPALKREMESRPSAPVPHPPRASRTSPESS